MSPQAADRDSDDVAAVTSAVLTASRVLVALSARSLAAAEERVTLPQFRLLVVLASHGETKQVTLAESLGVNPSTAMRMVDRLVATGLVSRNVNPSSRREVLLRLTDAGQQMVDEVTRQRRREISEIVARMPAEARNGLVEALRVFAEAAGEPPAGEGTGEGALTLGWR